MPPKPVVEIISKHKHDSALCKFQTVLMYSLAQRFFGLVLFYGRYIDTQWVGVGEHMAGKKLFQGIIEGIEERTSFIGQDLLETSQSPRG